VWRHAVYGELIDLKTLLEEHPEVDVDGYTDFDGRKALFESCLKGHTECAQLLIDHNANVNAKDNEGLSAIHVAAGYFRGGSVLSCVKLLVQNGAGVDCKDDDGGTPVMGSAFRGYLDTTQYLIYQKADIHYRAAEGEYKNKDVLFYSMYGGTSGTAFTFLCCDTDAKNVVMDDDCDITTVTRDAHIDEYKHVQAFVDVYHRILTRVLSEHVPVDPRFGLGQMGIYQEPLERTLEYLGLSMSKDQVVNMSIDGEAGRRALLPGHLLNAKHWFDKYESRKEKERLIAQLTEDLKASKTASRELTVELQASILLTRELETKIAVLLA
jgi:hypothetical protein